MNFDISYLIDALPRLLEGALITLQITLIGFVISLALATALTVMRETTKSKLAHNLLALYVSFIRGTPLLVQIFLIYYVTPVVGIDIGPVFAGILAISLNSAAFVVEILRGGLASVPKGQFEAAKSLGLKRGARWSKVILPQTFIASVPPLVNEFTQVLKATALLSTITIVELMRTAQQIYTRNYHPVEVLLGTFIIYFIMCFIVSRSASFLEGRLKPKRA